LNLLFTLSFGLKWKIWGILLAQPISYGIALFLFRVKTSLFFKPFLNKNLFIEEMKIGFPVWLNGLFYTFFIVIDRTLIPIGLGIEALGLYSLSSMARSSIGLIPSSVGDVVYMRGATEYGANEQRRPPLSLLLRTNRIIANFTALPIGIAILWAPVGVRLLLPSYLHGLLALQLFLFGLFFLFPTYGGTLLTIIGRAKRGICCVRHNRLSFKYS
jgi:O-antigen/teichoic acid export membrane protein